MPYRIFLAMAAALFSVTVLMAQNEPPASQPQTSAPTQTRQEPCWQEAGISPQVFRQHEAIERNKHSQVQSVCADISLTQQQKIEKIAEIREAAQQKNDALITPEQQKSVAACRQQRMGPNRERAFPCTGRRGSPQNGAPSGGQPNGAPAGPNSSSGNNSSQLQR